MTADRQEVLFTTERKQKERPPATPAEKEERRRWEAGWAKHEKREAAGELYEQNEPCCNDYWEDISRRPPIDQCSNNLRWRRFGYDEISADFEYEIVYWRILRKVVGFNKKKRVQEWNYYRRFERQQNCARLKELILRLRTTGAFRYTGGTVQWAGDWSNHYGFTMSHLWQQVQYNRVCNRALDRIAFTGRWKTITKDEFKTEFKAWQDKNDYPFQ